MISLAPDTGASQANLEQVYQQTLKDPEFEAIDSGLRAAYAAAMLSLPPADRIKLREAERLWIKENSRLIADHPQREAQFLKERFSKRRTELQQIKPSESLPPQASERTAAASYPPSSPPAAPSSGRATASNLTPAENLERAYQRALRDAEFEETDTVLRTLFKQALEVLPAADGKKLKTAEKLWIKENGELLPQSQPECFDFLKSRFSKRKDEIAQMKREQRFIAATPPPPTPPQEPVSHETPVAQESQPQSAPAPRQIQALTDEPAPAATPHIPTWVLLICWALSCTAFHYRTFLAVPRLPENRFLRFPNSARLYLLSVVGCILSQASPLILSSPFWIIVSQIAFTATGLLFLWAAAVDGAGVCFDAASKTLEIPDGLGRARLAAGDILRIKDSSATDTESRELQIHARADRWSLHFSSKEKRDGAACLIRQVGTALSKEESHSASQKSKSRN